MLSIQTNVNSLVAQENLSVNNKFQARTIQQLTSGYRINSSGDDAAGLAVANKFRNDVSELSQGVANGNDAVAQLQIMDGGMSNISQILDRLKTLATQSASASFTGDRSVLNNEFQTDVSEINRQAQAVGLNTGGTFAKSLDIYLGGGKGTSSASVLTNGTVNVDLSKATVDAQSLGLKGVQATNTGYDLGTTSATSLSKVLSDAANIAGESTANVAKFSFTGPGFGDSSKITINVNLNQVTDTKSLVTNINAAIQAQAQAAGATNTAFKGASISASINTDSTGKQQLTFNSSNAAFQVTSNDTMASALLGSFSAAGNGVTGNATSSLVAGASTEVASAGAAADMGWVDMAAADSQTVTFSANDASGKQHSVSVTLTDATNPVTIDNALTAINTKLQQSNDSTMQQITAVKTGAASLNFISTLPGFTVTVGADAVNPTGINTGAAITGQAVSVGTGSTADIGTQQSATYAVTSVSSAVAALGSAQAAIGKGQNQLNYAINLASSQITNFSAAASQIRDADVAQQAANLTKAQVLQQASIAAMAQANSAPQAVLSLLKG